MPGSSKSGGEPASKRTDIGRLLSKLPLFQQLSASEISKLAAGTREVSLSKGQTATPRAWPGKSTSNAVKHARASRITVQLRVTNQGEAVIEIDDNGIGLLDSSDRDGHFGLHIMRERADHLGGVLGLDSQPGNGLRVRLRFIPAARRRSLNASDEARYA